MNLQITQILMVLVMGASSLLNPEEGTVPVPNHQTWWLTP